MSQLFIDSREAPLPTPLNNFMFAAGFQSMESASSALSLTNAVLLNAARTPLEGIDELNCEQVLLGEGRKLRGCRLDLAIRDGNHRLNLEVQLAALNHMADRMVFNTSRMLSTNTISGTKYDELPKVTVISIVDFIYRKGHPDFHQPFGLFYEKDPKLVTDKIDYHLIEMPKFRALNPDVTNSLHRWLFYLNVGYKEPNSPIMKEAFQMDQGLYEFAQRYQRNIGDPKTLDAYYGYVMECMDERERIDTAINKRNIEIARNLLAMSMPLDQINAATGLTLAEIEKIKTVRS
jgi:predicted transposase/invertase (TIGR01784 family)